MVAKTRNLFHSHIRQNGKSRPLSLKAPAFPYLCNLIKNEIILRKLEQKRVHNREKMAGGPVGPGIKVGLFTNSQIWLSQVMV